MIELVIAMALFAILVALTVPSLRVWVNNDKIRSTADALQNGIRLAQTESLRRSRIVVFTLTNSTAPQTSLTAVANGSSWAIETIPAMTDGTELPAFIQSGMLTGTTAGVAITGPAAICFNSVGRLVPNTTTGITGATCALPTTGTPPVQPYKVTLATIAGSRPLNVEVALGGQVHMCDPAFVLSSTNPEGC